MARTYIVRSGDTVRTIAKQLNVDEQMLLGVNPGIGAIRPGLVLNTPKPPPPPQPINIEGAKYSPSVFRPAALPGEFAVPGTYFRPALPSGANRANLTQFGVEGTAQNLYNQLYNNPEQAPGFITDQRMEELSEIIMQLHSAEGFELMLQEQGYVPIQGGWIKAENMPNVGEPGGEYGGGGIDKDMKYGELREAFYKGRVEGGWTRQGFISEVGGKEYHYNPNTGRYASLDAISKQAKRLMGIY